ncbi:MAG: polysaccharide deacetylase family protein [bacterium]|nr:polysaccharide deacetylase family protein [bacterium]
MDIKKNKSKKASPKKQNKQGSWHFFVTLFSILLILLFSGSTLLWQIIKMQDNTASYRLYSRYNIVKEKTAHLINEQNIKEIHIVSDSTLYDNLNKIKTELNSRSYGGAQGDITNFRNDLANYEKEFQTKYEIEQKNKSEAAIIASEKEYIASGNAKGLSDIPILIYHKTPPNFPLILDYLSSHGYHTITMDSLSKHLRSGVGLPAKPIVITFDDGFSDQLKAYEILKARGMYATFYVLVGGERSNWCIGIEKHNINCGDSYLNWDQVKTLDKSGVIEIGAHTVDHLSLAAYSPSIQSFEIFESKRKLEEQLGHPVTTFAYPYGSFNGLIIDLVRQAGFSTAVTTVGGTGQSLDTIYTLKRIRNAFLLP